MISTKQKNKRAKKQATVQEKVNTVLARKLKALSVKLQDRFERLTQKRKRAILLLCFMAGTAYFGVQIIFGLLKNQSGPTEGMQLFPLQDTVKNGLLPAHRYPEYNASKDRSAENQGRDTALKSGIESPGSIPPLIKTDY